MNMLVLLQYNTMIFFQSKKTGEIELVSFSRKCNTSLTAEADSMQCRVRAFNEIIGHYNTIYPQTFKLYCGNIYTVETR